MSQDPPINQQLNISDDEWKKISKKDQEKLATTLFTSKPCAICARPVSVKSTHRGDTWCMAHGGTWKDEQ